MRLNIDKIDEYNREHFEERAWWEIAVTHDKELGILFRDRPGGRPLYFIKIEDFIEKES